MTSPANTWPFVGGDMAARVRAFDWGATSLGPVADWPVALRTIVELVLANSLVSSVACGPERLLIYNDASARLYGDRHPGALGRSLAEAFADSYPAVAALYDRVFAGETAEVRGQPLTVGTHDGVAEVFDAYLTPVRDATGAVIAAHMTGFEVGEQVRVQTALRESEERLRDVLDSMSEAFALFAPDFTILDVNVETTRLDGRPRDALIGQSQWDAFPGIEHSAVGELYRRVMRDREAGELEHRYEWPDGRTRWVEGRAYPTSDGNVASFFRDITERKQIEAALAASEARLRASERQQRLTLQLVPALLWSADPQGREITLNESWRNHTGQSEPETQDFGWLNAVHPDDLPATRAAFEQAFATGEALERDHRIRRADGTYRWHAVRHVPVRDARGAIAHWFGAALDIHESKLAEQAVDASERWLQVLMEGVPQLIWRGVDGGHWTWASPQWVEFTGQAEPDSHGLGWLEMVHPDDREPTMEIWKGAVARGEFRAEYRLCHADEERYRWFQTRATPVRDDRGTIVEWLGTSTDIDDLRELQERQNLLVAELQHRSRNILTVVRSVFGRTVEAGGDAEQIADHFKGRLDALARTQVIVTQSAHQTADLENLIRDELLSVGVGDGPDVTIAGPEVRLRHKDAESIGLAIHELTTNAIKYGALKAPGAKLNIGWKADLSYGKPGRLNLLWTEQGVPAIGLEPARRGFGRELIEEALPYRLGAETSFEIMGGGVRCSISVPLPAADDDAPARTGVGAL